MVDFRGPDLLGFEGKYGSSPARRGLPVLDRLLLVLFCVDGGVACLAPPGLSFVAPVAVEESGTAGTS